MPERTQLRVVLVKAGGSHPFSRQPVQKLNEPLVMNSRLNQSSGSTRGGSTDAPCVTFRTRYLATSIERGTRAGPKARMTTASTQWRLDSITSSVASRVDAILGAA